MDLTSDCTPRSLSLGGWLAAWATLVVTGTTTLALPFALLSADKAPEAQAIAQRPALNRNYRTQMPVPLYEGPSYPYYQQIQAVAKKYQVAPELIASIVRLESNFDRFCVSPVGAVGLMQLMPSTARGVARAMGRSHYDLTDAEDNLELGTAYLTMLLRDFDGHVPTALSFYNAGRNGIVSRGVYRNRRYIRIVMDNYWDYVRQQGDHPGETTVQAAGPRPAFN